MSNEAAVDLGAMVTDGEVAAVLRVTTGDLRELVARGRFPQPTVKLSQRRWRWRRETVEAVLGGKAMTSVVVV